MAQPRSRLRVEELGPRVLPSANPLIDPRDGPAHAAAHMGVHTPPKPADTFDGLDGTLTGWIKPSRVGPADAGLRFAVDGSGKLGGLDTFTVTGSLQGTGFIAKGHATGELTLTNALGTIKVKLQGPEQPGSAPLPGRFHFTVTAGTGAYKTLRDDGEVSLTTQRHGSATSFRLVFA